MLLRGSSCVLSPRLHILSCISCIRTLLLRRHLPAAHAMAWQRVFHPFFAALFYSHEQVSLSDSAGTRGALAGTRGALACSTKHHHRAWLGPSTRLAPRLPALHTPCTSHRPLLNVLQSATCHACRWSAAGLLLPRDMHAAARQRPKRTPLGAQLLGYVWCAAEAAGPLSCRWAAPCGWIVWCGWIVRR